MEDCTDVFKVNVWKKQTTLCPHSFDQNSVNGHILQQGRLEDVICVPRRKRLRVWALVL